MARTSRTRSNSSPFGTGFMMGSVNGVPFGADADNYAVKGSTMTDRRGRPTTPSPMDKTSFDKSGLELINGAKGNSSADPTWYNYVDYPIGRYATDYVTPVSLSWPHGHSSTFGTEILARTNPSRPDYNLGEWAQSIVDAPFSLFEIGSILRNPRRQRGRLDKLVASQYLSTKFGWNNLFLDIAKMTQVFTYIDRRNSELNRLFSGRGLKRRISLGRYTATNSGTQFVASGARGTLTCRAEQISRRRIWGTARWKPTIPPSYYPSDSERLALARTTVLGATASGAFVSSWDLIPWTWMLGWATNVRSYVLAHGNTVPAAPSAETCVMMHTESSRDFKVTSRSPELSGGDGTIAYEHKFRAVHAKASVSAYLPYLDGGRLSILGAMAVQRMR